MAKARPDRPKSPEDTAPRGTSVSEATESQKVEIPTTTGLDGVDYMRSSQERDDEETEHDKVIPNPKLVLWMRTGRSLSRRPLLTQLEQKLHVRSQ